MVKRLRILVPVTKDQITESRGVEARKQLQVIQRLINSTDPDFADSIIPIVTKCKPSDEDIDVENLRYILFTQLQ